MCMFKFVLVILDIVFIKVFMYFPLLLQTHCPFPPIKFGIWGLSTPPLPKLGVGSLPGQALPTRTVKQVACSGTVASNCSFLIPI